jgi:putative ABC transport system permease protein
MRIYRSIRLRIRSLFRRNCVEEELDTEMHDHLERQIQMHVSAGMSPGDARNIAMREFGNVALIQEQCRDMRRVRYIEDIFRDIKHTLRSMRRAPVFTAAALLTLALGIGANTAIFGVINSILIRPLSYPNAEALVSIRHTAPGVPNVGVFRCSPTMYFTYREENRTFQQFGLWNYGFPSVTGIDEPELPPAIVVTYGVLDALGVKPLMGRWFSQEDDSPGSPETVILTYGYWQRRFAADESVIGRVMTINSSPTTVIGVMPKKFRFQGDPELILPQRLERNKLFLGEFRYSGIARLKSGVTMEQANADVARMLGIWINAWPPPPGMDRAIFQNARFGPEIHTLKQEIVGDIGTVLWVVLGSLGLVLLIACANVANLLLVRAEGRRHELSIRAALGAGWSRIARGMLVESMTLGMIGGVLALGLAYVALRILSAKGPATLPRMGEIGVDPLVFAFALVVSLFAGVLFGLIPILKYARPGTMITLRDVGRTFSQGREHNRARNTLVVAQVALALVLLIGSGLMIRTFQNLRNVQPGFTHPEQIQILYSSVPAAMVGAERAMRMNEEILDKLSALPGVTSVGFANNAPLESYWRFDDPLYAEDKKLTEGEIPPIRQLRMIAPGFFRTMGTQIVTGRDFTWTDLYEKRHVAIVSENLAREWWDDPRNALGKRIRSNTEDPWREIVGVAADVYDDGMQMEPPKFAYLPALMDRWWASEHEYVVDRGMFAIRSNRTGTEGLLTEARQAILSVNGGQPVFGVRTLKELYDQSMARTSFTLVMLALAGGMSLVLGIVGIYGVIAYTVSQRTRDIGIRIAVGAQRAELLRMFVRQGLLLAGIGTVLGLAAAAGLTRLMSSLLFGVTALDPLTYAAVSALLLIVAALASYIPAHRAASVDPVSALRAE